MKYTRPQCTFTGCDRGADLYAPPDPRFPDATLPVCARHAVTECACGGLVREIMAADGLECDACAIMAAEHAHMEG